MRFWSRSPRDAPSPPRTLPASRGLFILGAARSGTTILQNALNESPEIFIFGEPNLHLEVGEGAFAARYNAMHRAWANQETKSTYCPPILALDGTSEDHLNALSGAYTWVGSKIVVNARREDDWLTRLKAFHCQRFYTAHYIFTFRAPLPVVLSTRGLQILTGAETASISNLLANYLEVVLLFIWASRNLKHARAIIHEDVDDSVMAKLGQWLGTDLSNSMQYYDQSRIGAHSDRDLTADERRDVEKVDQLYIDLGKLISFGFKKFQLEQNDNNFSTSHYTELGQLARKASTILQHLRAQ